MADQQSILQVNVDLGTSVQTVGQLRDEFDSLTAAEGKATDANEKFNFSNEEAIALSGRYADALKQVQQQVEQTTSEISTGFQSAATIASASVSDLGRNVSASFNAINADIEKALAQTESEIGQAGQATIGSLSQQRIAFMDLGRVVDGQGLSLRNFSSTLGLLGPEGFIVGAALAGIGYALYSLIDTSKSVAEALKEVNDQFDKLQARDKYITQSVDEQTELLKSRAKAVGASVDEIAAIEEKGAQQRITTAQETLDELNQQQKKAVAAYLKDDSDKNKAIVDGLNSSIAKQQDILKASQDRAEEIDNDALARDLKSSQEKDKRRQQDLIALRAYEDGISEVTSDARTRELAAAQKQYDEMAAKFKDFSDLETRLAEDYRVKVAAINVKYDAAEAAEIAKLEQDELKQQAKYIEDEGKVVDEYEQKRRKADQNNRENDLALENAAYQKAVGAAMTVGEDLTAVEDAHRREVAQINSDWDAKDLKQAEQATNRQIALIRELYKAGDKGTAIERDENRIAELNAIKKSLTDELAAVGNNVKQQEVIRKQLVATDTQLTAAQGQLSKDRIAQQDQELTEIGQILNSLAALAGKNTETGKDLAVAATIISTYAAAQKAYESQFLPVPDISSPVRGAIAAAVAVAAGLENVKQIESVSIPGGSGGGSSSSSLPSGGGGSYSGPVLPSSSNQTTLSPQSINQITDNLNNSPSRVFVVESDITEAQQRVLGYQQASVL